MQAISCTDAVCYSEKECKIKAEMLGLELGNPFAGLKFAGNWTTKGLYTYYKGPNEGKAFFGTHGTNEQMEATEVEEEGQYRPRVTSANCRLADLLSRDQFKELLKIEHKELLNRAR